MHHGAPSTANYGTDRRPRARPRTRRTTADQHDWDRRLEHHTPHVTTARWCLQEEAGCLNRCLLGSFARNAARTQTACTLAIEWTLSPTLGAAAAAQPQSEQPQQRAIGSTCPQGATTAGETVPSWFARLGQPSWPVSTRGIRANSVWSQPASVRSCRNWTTSPTLQPDTDRPTIACGTQRDQTTKNIATRAKTNNPNSHAVRPFGATGHRSGSPQSYGPQDRPSRATERC